MNIDDITIVHNIKLTAGESCDGTALSTGNSGQSREAGFSSSESTIQMSVHVGAGEERSGFVLQL